MPNVEFKRKAWLSRQEVADRLITLGNALANGSEIELSSGGDTLKLGVAGHVNWELEIEIKWTDDPSRNAAPATGDPAAAEPAAAEPAADPAPVSERPASARRGRPRKIATT